VACGVIFDVCGGFINMINNYTARYIKTDSGYTGQLVDWAEVITEGETIEECRELLKDALKEMIHAYKEQNKEIPSGNNLLEQISIEV
jgi:predicted RNase H-like HicB family nuclease